MILPHNHQWDEAIAAVGSPPWPNWKPTAAEMSKTLHGVPCVYPDATETIPEAQAWTSAPHIGPHTMDVIEAYFGNEHPKHILEIGSFLGTSIIALLSRFKFATACCVDTWCGDATMKLHPRFRPWMQTRDGEPRLYQQFLSATHAYRDRLVPLRMSSVSGMRVLLGLGFAPDLIYLDSAHEQGESFVEISWAASILAPCGIIVGDDYEDFPGLRNDIDRFAKMSGARIRFTGDHGIWYMCKDKQCHMTP